MAGGFETGGSQFNGGGFMPSPAAHDGPGSAQKKAYDQQSQSVRRLTIKQLHDGVEGSAADGVMVDGKEVSNVALVGKIVDVKEDNVTFNMHLDDGTGKIMVKMFINNDGNEDIERQQRAELLEGSYARVFGHIGNYNNERQINAFSIRPVKDHNEVTYHLSQVIFQHLHLTKGSLGEGQNLGGNMDAVKSHMAPVVPAVVGGMAPVDSEVLNIFNTPEAMNLDAGLTVADVVSRSSNRFDHQTVMGAINRLVDEGHLYSTIDDAHWKSCAV